MIRLWALAAAFLGLGVEIALGTGDVRAVRIVFAVVAAIAMAVLARVSQTWMVVGAVAVGGVAAAVETAVAASGSTAVSGVLVAVATLVGAWVVREPTTAGLDWKLDAVSLPWAESGDPPMLDGEVVAAELNRARRYGRPLTVLTIALPELRGGRLTRRAVVRDLGASLSATLRQSDLIGHQTSSRLVAVLPETTGADAELLIGRLLALVDHDLAAGLRFGLACFPSEEVTWVGLEKRAIERERTDGLPPFLDAAPAREPVADVERHPRELLGELR